MYNRLYQEGETSLKGAYTEFSFHLLNFSMNPISL